MNIVQTYIIVFPYSSNIGTGKDGKLQPHLSVLSRMALVGAKELLWQNPAASLVIPGETCYGSGYASTGDLMAAEVKLPMTKIINLKTLSDGRYLNNTYLQVEAVEQFLSGKGDDVQVMSVALDYHLQRVKQIMAAIGVSSEFYSAESLLESTGDDTYQKYYGLIDRLRWSERLLRLLGQIDQKGIITNWLTGRFGARLVDVIEDKSGLCLENTRARKKLKHLEYEGK